MSARGSLERARRALVAEGVALVRVVEGRLRRDPTLRRLARGALAIAARRSPEVRDYVRLRLMRII